MLDPKPIDAIDELVARSKDLKELQSEEQKELSRFHKFHRAHPEILDFLVMEIRLLINRGFPGFSFASLCHYSRWKLKLKTGPTTTYALNDHVAPMYARAILILHPALNGKAEMREPCTANRIFGTRVAPDKQAGDYARRLEWADGTSLENGWRPTIPHVINHAANRRPDVHPRD